MINLDLKNAGLKTTDPRRKILNILEDLRDHHVSAEDIYQHLMESEQKISLATIYRVLAQFYAAGIVKRHSFEEGHAVFELNTGEHHDHLVCLKCNIVVEFFDDLIEKQQQLVAKKAGFSMVDHSLTMYGLCQKCQKTKKLKVA